MRLRASTLLPALLLAGQIAFAQQDARLDELTISALDRAIAASEDEDFIRAARRALRDLR